MRIFDLSKGGRLVLPFGKFTNHHGAIRVDLGPGKMTDCFVSNDRKNPPAFTVEFTCFQTGCPTPVACDEPETTLIVIEGEVNEPEEQTDAIVLNLHPHLQTNDIYVTEEMSGNEVGGRPGSLLSKARISLRTKSQPETYASYIRSLDNENQ